MGGECARTRFPVPGNRDRLPAGAAVDGAIHHRRQACAQDGPVLCQLGCDSKMPEAVADAGESGEFNRIDVTGCSATFFRRDSDMV